MECPNWLKTAVRGPDLILFKLKLNLASENNQSRNITITIKTILLQILNSDFSSTYELSISSPLEIGFSS